MRPLIAALLALAFALPLRAADNSFLYGTDKPNASQLLNRHLTLLEHAMLDLIMTRYANDVQHDAYMTKNVKDFKATPKSGYNFDRKAKYELTWADYSAALAPLKKNPADLKPAAGFASKTRGTMRWVAADYLAATAGGKGEKEKLSDLESDLLVSYLKWAPQDVFEKFKREWIEVTVPRSTEEHYLLQQRVSHCRAFLRSELKAYADQTPVGVQDPSAQFSALSTKAQALVSEEKAKLLPFYAAAGMAYFEKPAATRTGTSGKPFVYRFSSQENAILTYLMAGERDKKAFQADQEAADKDAAKMDPLVGAWRARVLTEATTYLKTPVTGALDPFEATYIQWRLKPVDPKHWEALEKLSAQAEELVKAGDTGAPARVGATLRPLIVKDLSGYAAGKTDDTALKDWAQKWLQPDANFDLLFPRPISGVPKTAAQALDLLFSNPVERAFAEHLLSKADDRAAKEAALIKAATNGDASLAAAMRKDLVAAVGAHLDAKDPAVQALLDKRGVTEKDLLKYYCPQAPAPGAAPDGTKAMSQLEHAEKTGQNASGNASSEGAKAGAQLEAGGRRSAQLCQDYDNARKLEEANTGTNKPDGGPSSRINPVPSLTGPGTAHLKAAPAAPEPLSTTEKMDRVAGAATGFGLFGLMALALGLGPVGIVLMLVAGVAVGAGAVHLMSKKKK